ncbi:MAG: hypothetical protein H7A25_01675 [Leptospiraceae bacterium]|nr:hypothetical protein [Leptospiraceae bacterium]
MNKRKLQKTFDEVFKKRAIAFFSKFAKVETEFELHRLPRKLDVLIIESDKPIRQHLDLMNYFQEFNIIEFKSESQGVKLQDIYKTLYYISAFVLRKKEKGDISFTLITTKKPERFLETYHFLEKRKGLYVMEISGIIKIHCIVISELDKNTDRELEFLQIFTAKKQRKEIIREAIEKGFGENLKDSFLLYREEVESILKEMGKSMTAIEERVWELAEEFGIREKIREASIQEGREQERLLAEKEIEKTQRLASFREKRAEHKKALRTAINLKKEGAELKFISRITELPEAYLEKFFRKAIRGEE